MKIKQLSLITYLILNFTILIFAIIIIPKVEKKVYSEFEVYYNDCIKKYENENKIFKQNKTEIDVVFIGDSITVGFELFKDQFIEYNCLYRGIGGDNTFTMFDRLDVSLYQVKPKVIVMCIGGNNIYTMFENYVDIIIGIRNNLPSTQVIIHSIYPTNKSYVDRNKVIPDINVRIKNIANAYKYIFVDTHSKLLDKNNAFNLLYTDDGAHPNIAGYEIIISVLKPYIDNCLKNNN